DLALGGGQFQMVEEMLGVANRERGRLDDILAVDEHMQSLLAQALALAGLAEVVAEEVLGAESLAHRACAIGRVERKEARLDLGIREAVVGAHELDRHELLL